MPKHFPLTLALAASLLGGCSFMPDYVRPNAPIPAQWPESARAEGARLAETLEWQDYFPDERLQALITAALAHNRDMRIAVARVDEARVQYGIQRADRLPSINASASENASRSPGELLPGGGSTVSRRYDVNLGMPAFEIDFWGRVASLSEAARASYLATKEAQRAFRLSLIASVADGYLSLKEAEERTTLARQTLEARAETQRLVVKRREVGLAGDLDYLQADGAFQSARAELAGLERQRAVAQNFLQALVGTDRTDWPKGRSLNDQGIVVDLAADLPSEILTRRPDVLVAEQRLIATNANIGAARAAFLPRISLTTTAGTASHELSGLFESDSRAWSFQPTISLPLFDFGRTSANLELANARKVIAVAEYEKAIQQAFREVADLLAAREKLAEQLGAQEAFEKTQRQRLVLAKARYSSGIASFLEVLDAQRDEFSAQQGVIQTRRNMLSVAAQLYKAVGGGTRLETSKP